MKALQNRIPPPVVMLTSALVMWLMPQSLQQREPWRAAAALFVVGLAGGLGFSALRAFRRANTTVDPIHINRASALVTTGIFRFTRNPMYLALALLLVAWALWCRGLWVWCGPLAFVVFIDRLQIIPEERAILERFGADYQRYCQRVRRWL